MKRKVKIISIIVVLFFIATIIFLIIYNGKNTEKNEDIVMSDLSTYTIEEIKEYAKEYGLRLTISEEYSDLDKKAFINQSIKPGEIIKTKTLVVLFLMVLVIKNYMHH
jgi:ABC-type dipeptide/oligopeptide/nickel transport system permease component